MDDSSSAPLTPAAETEAPPAPKPKRQRNPIRTITLVVLAIALGLFVYKLIADRWTPYTDQGAVQAYVVNMAPDVSGRVTSVNVADNQFVEVGRVLYTIDSERYKIALETAQAQLANAGQGVGASTASLEAAQARLALAEAKLVNAQLQTARVLTLVRSGVNSKASGDDATAALDTATADVERSKAEVEQARQNLGPTGSANPQIRQAQAALDKARRDLSDTVVRAPGNGAVTNLQLASGRFVAAGQTALSFIDSDAVWIESEFRENALEHIKVGDKVGIALDVRPGRVYPGTVEGIGWGIDNRDVDAQTGLPAVSNDTGWVRDPQRFIVRVKFDPDRRPNEIRVGSQASVVVYTGRNGLTDAIGGLWIGLISYLSYIN